MNKIIGITGIMGSGKTTLMNQLKDKLANNYEFIDFDIYRRELIKKNKEILKILNIKEEIDINKIIYNDVDKMKKFKKYLYKNLVNDLSKTNKFIILEWALLIDDGLDKYCDYIFILDCHKKVILKRLANCGLSNEEIEKRISMQLPINKKIKLLNNLNYQVINSNRKINIENIIKKIREVSNEL